MIFSMPGLLSLLILVLWNEGTDDSTRFYIVGSYKRVALNIILVTTISAENPTLVINAKNVDLSLHMATMV